MELTTRTTVAERLTDWAKEPKYTDLYEDYSVAQAAHNMFLKDLDQYRETLDGGKKIRVRKGKSNQYPLLVRKNNEWKYSQLEEPFLSTPNFVKLAPKSDEDAATYKQAESMMNHYWGVDIDKIGLIGNIARYLTDEGTVIVKNGWFTEKEKQVKIVMEPVYATPEERMVLLESMVANGEMNPDEAKARLQSDSPMVIGEKEAEKITWKIIKNHPTHSVCELEDVIVDPTCKGDLNKAQFVVHEYDVDYSTLVRDKYDAETGVGFYKNLDAIDFKQDWEDMSDYATEKEASFVFSDKARKKVRIREYWGNWDIHGTGIVEPIVGSWIGSTMVRLSKNPFAHKKIPFSATTYMPVKKQFHGEPDGALLKENQDSIRRMTNALHDITSTKAVGQKLTMEDTFGSQAEWDAYNVGNDARFRPGIDINKAVHINSVDSVDPAVFQVIDFQQREAESLTGNAAYNKGLAGANQNASATGIRSAMDSSSRRELSILRRMSSQLFKDMIKQDIANMQMFASPEEVVRVTNSEFVTIKREDIQGQYDIIIDVTTPAKNQETADGLSFIMQAAGDTVDPKIKNMVLADIARLKQRPDLAKQIEEYEPQPSEAQVKMEQMQMANLELENKMLQMQMAKLAKDIEEADSRIEERNSRTAENIQADVKLKTAKAEEHMKRADYYESQADLSDAKFVNEANGITRDREIADKEFDMANKFELERMKAEQKIAEQQNKQQREGE